MGSLDATVQPQPLPQSQQPSLSSSPSLPSDWEKAWFAFHLGTSLFSGAVGLLGFFDRPLPVKSNINALSLVDASIVAADDADVVGVSSSTLNSAISVLERLASGPPSADQQPVTAPMFGLLQTNSTAPSTTTTSSTVAPIGSPNRRDNVSSLANLCALALLQNHEISDSAVSQVAVANDAIVAFLSYEGLTSKTASERRLMHRSLGLIKTTQYIVCMLDDRFNNSYLGPNLVGLGLTIAATFHWGVGVETKRRVLGWLFLGGVSSTKRVAGIRKRRSSRKVVEEKQEEVEEEEEAFVESTAGAVTNNIINTNVIFNEPSASTSAATATGNSPAPSDATLTELPTDIEIEKSKTLVDTLPPLLDMNNEWRS
ncbi:UNVERIFIED_CONTAM: hypothetical protein HDU68_010117 [Siphonaria sp. JEL0065]|nr:hypothetical protein HDU68_010117 [Siphonaria sp. JEL0065]